MNVSEKQLTEKKEELLKKLKIAHDKKITMKEGKKDSEGKNDREKEEEEEEE